MNNESSESRYESAVAELEKIVQDMESGELSLEQSLAAYTKGISLLKQCQQWLNNAEQQVQMLNEKQQLEPFEPEPL